ncbi:MAG: Gfo/Idh/MocA family oxidoreductase [Candidatus Methanoperedens sp.]
MNVGVIGTGTMGKNHARIYSEFKGIEETYVFDANKTNATEIKDFGALACDSMEELLDKVDAVSICVPTKYHFQVAKEVIEKDIHCLIEKPIAQSVAEAEKLVGLLKTKSLIAGVGHIERFNPIVAEIRKIIKNPFFVEMRRHNPASSRITDASVIEDLMIHDIDILFNVFFAKKNYTMHSAGNFDVCKAMVAFNGSIASLSASRKASKKIRTVYIEEEDFTIEGDFMTQEIYTYNKPEKYRMENDKYTQENIIEKILVNKVEPLKVELKTFIDCVKKNSEFPITPEQALNNLRICEEIKKGF